VVLVDPANRPDRTQSEEQAAHHLLSTGLDSLEISYDAEFQSEEVMACMSVAYDMDNLGQCTGMLLGFESDINSELGDLISMGLAEAEDGRVILTGLGSVAVAHFIEPHTAEKLATLVEEERHPLDVVAELLPFDGVHSRLAERISNSLGYPVPSRIFSGGFLDVLSDGDVLQDLDPDTRDRLIEFASRFLRCDCRGAPHCPCAQREFSREVLDLWVELRNLKAVISRLEEDFDAYAYEGDLTDYLDDSLRLLEAVRDVAAQKGKTEIAGKATELIK
jgi:superfamily II helicase